MTCPKPQKESGVFEIKTLKIFLEWGFSGHMHSNFIGSSLLTSAIALQRGLLCFPVNVIILTKQAAFLWCARDFFFFMVLIDLYPPKDSELCKYLKS